MLKIPIALQLASGDNILILKLNMKNQVLNKFNYIILAILNFYFRQKKQIMEY